MNTVFYSKKLATPLCAGLLLMAFATHAAEPNSPSTPSKYIYTASNLSVHFINSAGQRNNLNIQQCGKQEIPANATNTNYFNVDNAETEAFGIAQLQTVVSCVGNINSGNTDGFQMYVNLQNVDYSLFQNTIQLEANDQVMLSSSSGGMPSYTLRDDLDLVQTGISILPKGTHIAGETFDVSAPVSVTTDAGTTETDTFNGKLVLGEAHPLRGDDGKVVGTRFVEIHIRGKVTASDGGTYEIDENFGQTDLRGIMPDQLSLNFTLTAQ